MLLDGIARIAKGEAIAAGIPEDRMPEVTIDDTFTPATFNDPALTERMAALFKASFPEGRVNQVPAVMGGEDFSQFRRADPDNVQSLIFWVGGVPQAEYEAAMREKRDLPSLHSPYWAPDAEKVIATASEAMVLATLNLMPKK